MSLECLATPYERLPQWTQVAMAAKCLLYETPILFNNIGVQLDTQLIGLDSQQVQVKHRVDVGSQE